MTQLKVSIITVTYNAEKFIERAILSVIAQTYQNIEHIIIDGQSQDKTLEIINRHKTKIHRIVSEKDSGVYDAMNKGLSLATGDILYFLNSDDYFCDPNVINDIAEVFLKDPNIGLVCSTVNLEDIPNSTAQPNLKAFQGDVSSRKEILEFGICHQRIFAGKWVFGKTGQFNSRRKIYADLEWYLSVLNHDVSIKFINRRVVNFYAQGMSHTLRNRAALERLAVIYRQSSIMEFIEFLFTIYPRCILRRFLTDKDKS